jgi:hypothetical protein
MIPRKTTAVIFLAFSVVVAFKNYLIGEYQYALFTIPFIAAVLSDLRISRVCEVVGLVATSCYIMACQVFHVGMIGMVISTVFFFTLGYNLRIARIYIFCSISVVFACSYFQFIKADNMLLRAALDTALYSVSAFCVYIALQEYISANVKEAVSVAKEAIEIAKKEIKDGQR